MTSPLDTFSLCHSLQCCAGHVSCIPSPMQLVMYSSYRSQESGALVQCLPPMLGCFCLSLQSLRLAGGRRKTRALAEKRCKTSRLQANVVRRASSLRLGSRAHGDAANVAKMGFDHCQPGHQASEACALCYVLVPSFRAKAAEVYFAYYLV